MQIASQWQEAAETDPALLEHSIRGCWWETLARHGITILVTREYEHLVMAMRVTNRGPDISYLRLPHPSGLVPDRERGRVYIASTRNPNQIYEFRPATPSTSPTTESTEPQRPLLPVTSQFFPGSLYLHDLALIGGALHANAVGQNAVVRIHSGGRVERVWWPRCVETDSGPVFDRNHLQLNSIAAGADLESSYFTASTDKLSARRPGHKNFPVDRRGVLFSGATREAVAGGLTRPHSARLHEGRVWLDNSGYGELGVVENDRFTPVVRLPGWTRGLAFRRGTAFVGTSRVIPRFRQYAPGLEVDASACGVHAVDLQSGEVLGSLLWPSGNQIFAIDWVPGDLASGLPFSAGRRRREREKELFFAYRLRSEVR